MNINKLDNEMKTAMVFCAGMGTRLRPLTDNIPKALVTVGNSVLLDYQIENLEKYGYTNLIFNTHHHSSVFKEHISKNYKNSSNIIISDETELLLNTGGGLKQVVSSFGVKTDLMVRNVDVISDIDMDDMLEYHKKNDNMITMAVRKRTTQRYLLFDTNNNLKGWMNEKNGDFKNVNSDIGLNKYAFSGIYIISPKAFNMFPDEKIFSIIDFFLDVSKTEKIMAYDHSDTRWLDVGKPESLREALEIFPELGE